MKNRNRVVEWANKDPHGEGRISFNCLEDHRYSDDDKQHRECDLKRNPDIWTHS
jgi:hypothetical protein